MLDDFWKRSLNLYTETKGDLRVTYTIPGTYIFYDPYLQVSTRQTHQRFFICISNFPMKIRVIFVHKVSITVLFIQCVPQKRKPINRVNFSENCNDLSEKAYIFTKFRLSSFFWHQLQDVLAMHEQARTI